MRSEPVARRAGLTRRELLARAASGVTTLALTPALLSACGGGDSGASGSKGSKGTVRFSNWPAYIDEDHQTLTDFTKQSGYGVRYDEDINDNEEWYAANAPKLERDQSTGTDLVVLTDWMVARLIRQNYLEQLDDAHIPNKGNILDSLAHPDYDPGRQYSLPWVVAMTGIAYNPKRTKRRLTSIEDLFDPAFKGAVTMLTEMRDSLGLAMLLNGDDPTKPTIDAAQKAADRIREARDSGQIRRFTGNDYLEDLASGNVYVAVAWSGDIASARADQPDLEFFVPDEGGFIFSDNLVIPKGAKNKAGAEAVMNWFYDPEVAARKALATKYASPVRGAQERLAALDGAAAKDPLLNPDAATQARLRRFGTLDPDTEKTFNELFQAVVEG